MSTVIPIRIEGLRLEGLNRRQFGASQKAVFAKSRAIAAVRDSVATHCLRFVRFGRLEAIRVTRISAGTLDDDNLVGACKPVLDGIAKAFGVNDKTFVILGDREGVKVTPLQRSEGRGKFALEIHLTLGEGP